MKKPSMESVKRVVGLFMISAFIIILCYGINPAPLKEFAINIAKLAGIIALGVGGVWLVMKR